MSGARLAMNVLAFQAAWLGTVGGAAVGRLWIGPVAALALVACHVALAIALGAVFGPLCYQAGAALGALRLVEPYAALGVQAAAWAVLLPVSVAVAARYDGVQWPARAEHAHV